MAKCPMPAPRPSRAMPGGYGSGRPGTAPSRHSPPGRRHGGTRARSETRRSGAQPGRWRPRDRLGGACMADRPGDTLLVGPAMGGGIGPVRGVGLGSRRY